MQVRIAVDLKVLPLPEVSVQVPVTVAGIAVAFIQVAIPALGPGALLGVKLTFTGSETDQLTFDKGGPSCRHPGENSGTAPNCVVFAGGVPSCIAVAVGGITWIAIIAVQLVPPQVERTTSKDSTPANNSSSDFISANSSATRKKIRPERKRRVKTNQLLALNGFDIYPRRI